MKTTFRARAGGAAAAALAGCVAAVLPCAGLRAAPAQAQPPDAQAAREKQEEEEFHQGFVWKGKHVGGVNDFRRLAPMALRGDPYAAAVQRARALASEGKHAEAGAAFARAARLDRKFAPYDEWGDALEAAGDVEGAVAAYRQAAYRDLPRRGREARDWKDGEGRSVRAQVQAADEREWIANRSWSPALLMRYALLLSRAGETGEALQAYRWGLDAAVESRVSFGTGLGAWFDLKMSTGDFDRRRFAAAAYTVIGLTEDTLRTFAASAWPANGAVDAYRKALAAKPDYGPAHLFLGDAYLQKAPLDEHHYRAAAREAWRKAAAAGPAAVREAAERRLGAQDGAEP